MNNTPKLVRWLASTQCIVICLVLMMVLVILGTFAQVEIGAFAAQHYYFNCFWVFQDIGGISLPVFPGGLTVGLLWLASLIAASFTRFRWTMKNAGLLLSHVGIILLIFGQGLTQLLSEESMMSIEEGQTSNYTEITRDIELVFIDTSNSDTHEVVSIPSSRLEAGAVIETPKLPFSVTIKEFYRNSRLQMKQGSTQSVATQGIGPQISVIPATPTLKDDERNTPSAIIELKDPSRSLGTWVVSTGLQAPQSFLAGEKNYNLFLRIKRRYFPFSLTLKKFSHDVYAGTDIPKNFSSVVRISYPEKNEARDALIYMNHPLRFEGFTFYQASFGKNDTLSILQVVKNPAWLTPYISCIVVTLGLLIQFFGHMFSKRKGLV